MDFKQVLLKRHSIRQFKSDPVPNRTIRKIISLSQTAPSAGNLQSYKVFITKEKLVHIESPRYLVICSDADRSSSRYGSRGKQLYAIQDATIFASYIQLVAVNEGLDTCWVGSFSEKTIRKKLHIPNNLKPIAVICIGFGKIKKTKKRRRPTKEIMTNNK